MIRVPECVTHLRQAPFRGPRVNRLSRFGNDQGEDATKRRASITEVPIMVRTEIR